MSLFGSIRIAANAMRADDIGLQVVGQNIANANTPGYIRERLQLQTAPVQKMGDLSLGLGVQVNGVVQSLDKFLQQRLQGAISDTANNATQQSTYSQLETLLGSLGDTSTGAELTAFFNSISNVLNQPNDVSSRNLVVLQGKALGLNVNHLSDQVMQMRKDLNNQVIDSADSINKLTEKIRTLNIQIASMEGGGASRSDAIGLRDQRETALADLSNLVGVKSIEQPDGTVSVYCGSTYLVTEGLAQKVEVVFDTGSPGLATASLHIQGNDAPLDTSSGKVQGLISSRDEILGGFLNQLDDFSATLAFEFNKIYSQGQGLTGYQDITSEFSVDSADKALDDAGLEFTPQSGSFQIVVRDKSTGQSKTSDIFIQLDGPGKPTSLNDLVTQLNRVGGVTASVTKDGKLNILADAGSDFTFAGDNSGSLAALGVNTFFSGSSSSNLGVSKLLQSDPGKFAASQGGMGKDTKIAVQLAGLGDLTLANHDGNTINFMYDKLSADVAQNSSVAKSLADSSQAYQDALQGQQSAISGVNIDEEAVTMMSYQRSFQAQAKFISVVNELLQVLVSL